MIIVPFSDYGTYEENRRHYDKKSFSTDAKSSLIWELKLTDAVKQYIVDGHMIRNMGHPLRRMSQTKLEDALADELLSGKCSQRRYRYSPCGKR